MDNRAEMLKFLILLKYKSYSEFAKLINMPQSTLISALNNDIDDMSINDFVKICYFLEISTDDLAFERFDNILTPEFQELVDNAKHLSPDQLESINIFIDNMKKNYSTTL